MVVPSSSQTDIPIAVVLGEESDYGSDLDEATVTQLLAQTEVVATIEPPAILDDHGDTQPLLRLSRPEKSVENVDRGSLDTQEASHLSRPQKDPRIEVEYDESNRRTFSPPLLEIDKSQAQEQEDQLQREDFVDDAESDTRSPLQRFRVPPKKPLSVTDLVSPAWCELQYWYSLTRYGRVRRTPAMKQGSSVHKVLEEQVHTQVPVDVVTKEDRFALRLWNVISGLHTLRDTGRTRELEVWGVVEGEVINGIIDEVTTICPDEEAETRLLLEREGQENTKGKKENRSLPSDQRTLTDYLTNSSPHASILEKHQSAGTWLGSLQAEQLRQVYLVDVKTRQSKTLPNEGGSQLRPTQYQLMLYHRLLSSLASNEVPAAAIFTRYGVNPDKTLSDTFLAQMSSLSESLPSSSYNSDLTEDPLDLLLSHNTLSLLWTLMITTFTQILPSPTSSNSQSPSMHPPISPLLTASFHHASTFTLLGTRSFLFSPLALDAYVRDELRWWRGERETRGVEVEEAYKCRICEFAEGCEWRATKVEEGVKRARERRALRVEKEEGRREKSMV